MKFCLDVSILLFLVSVVSTIQTFTYCSAEADALTCLLKCEPPLKTDNEMLPFEWLQPHIVRHFSQFILKLTFDPVEFVFKAVICIAAGDNTVQQLLLAV